MRPMHGLIAPFILIFGLQFSMSMSGCGGDTIVDPLELEREVVIRFSNFCGAQTLLVYVNEEGERDGLLILEEDEEDLGSVLRTFLIPKSHRVLTWTLRGDVAIVSGTQTLSGDHELIDITCGGSFSCF